MLRGQRDRGIPSSLARPIEITGSNRGGFILIPRCIAGKYIIGRKMHHRKIMICCQPSQFCRTCCVHRPASGPIHLGMVHRGVGCRINNHRILIPIHCILKSLIIRGEVKIRMVTQCCVGKLGGQSPPHLTIRPGDQNLPGRHGGGVGKQRMSAIGGGNFGLIQRNWPANA